MRAMVLVVAMVAALAVPVAGSATAPDVAYLQITTASSYNARLRLEGEAFRVGTVRCMREAPGYYFCVGLLRGGGFGGMKAVWRVTWNGQPGGLISWARPTVLSA